MRDFAKQLLPAPVLRRVRAVRLRRNRHDIVQTARRFGKVVLAPDVVVEHFYHFMFDLTLPLFLAIDASPPGSTFVINTTGPFLPRLEQLFPGQVSIAARGDDFSGLQQRVLLGMNPLFVDVTPDQALAFSRHGRARVGVPLDATRDKVLLIERLPPQEFFRTAARSKGGGTRRRSIPNHDELVEALRGLVRPPLTFHNVQLETLEFAQQVDLFARAALVVGQHGAGLANTVWMAPGSKVVELTNVPELEHFQRLSRAMRHDHILHRTTGAHDPVDVRRLADELRREPRLREVLKA